ncbi:MAG: hypothetical protein KBT51_01890 [Cycloclasticus sp.]|nr:hypothetical protein [Cycloclasticus sp.]
MELKPIDHSRIRSHLWLDSTLSFSANKPSKPGVQKGTRFLYVSLIVARKDHSKK